jgi:hypothetical protein
LFLEQGLLILAYLLAKTSMETIAAVLTVSF